MESTPERRMRPAALIVLGVGVLLTALWLALLIPTLAFALRAHAAQGVFDGSVERRGGNHGGTFLHPQFRFRSDDGREVIFTSNVGSTDQPYEDGQRVRLLYDPKDPTHAFRDSLWDLWLAPLVTLPFAALPLGIGLLLLRDASRRRFPMR